MLKTSSEGRKKTKTGTGKHITFFLIALAVVITDQFVKLIVRGYFSYSKNTGAAFGIFQNQPALLAWIGVIIIGAILFFYSEIPDNKVARIGVALMLGGVIGNLIDRVLLGYVTDFINLRIWPSFNIADSGATIGVLLLLYFLIKEK
jgi:signal peptidase II